MPRNDNNSHTYIYIYISLLAAHTQKYQNTKCYEMRECVPSPSPNARPNIIESSQSGGKGKGSKAKQSKAPPHPDYGNKEERRFIPAKNSL
ncbi:hypothetical protein I7I53_10849 [Histoplasma capsulatum var. duboisii H88]|uniref:Uncharacterized protein n=1 Tax=Ajellomyces capsulatus (strain H88) TaxID=544711 RepID=A0A8A1LE01_AJEC8|nr:hypothetical protein I7I53_10849 [Histoplasma capsulatum var. duboisii H88]